MTHVYPLTEHLEAPSRLRAGRSFTREGVSREGPEGEEGATDGSKLRDSDVLPSAPCYPALPVQKELARSSLVRNP